MDPVGAWTTLLSSAALVLWAALVVRTRLPRRTVDIALAIGGAGVALGGLLFLDEVGAISWLVAPVVLAVLVVAHVRVLFAGAGPFRT